MSDLQPLASPPRQSIGGFRVYLRFMGLGFGCIEIPLEDPRAVREGIAERYRLKPPSTYSAEGMVERYRQNLLRLKL